MNRRTKGVSVACLEQSGGGAACPDVEPITMKKQLLLWILLFAVLAIFTVANWVIHSHERWWFNTLDYGVDIRPEKHAESVVVSVDFTTDDYHGKGGIEIEGIEISGHPIEFELLDSKQSTFHLGDRYKLDSLHVRVLMKYEDALVGLPMRIRGGLYYKHSMTEKTDHHLFDITTELKTRDNRLVFNRMKYPVK